MPCEICGTSVARTYSHARSSYHKKLLFAKMKEFKQQQIEKYGYYKWDDFSIEQEA